MKPGWNAIGEARFMKAAVLMAAMEPALVLVAVTASAVVLVVVKMGVVALVAVLAGVVILVAVTVGMVVLLALVFLVVRDLKYRTRSVNPAQLGLFAQYSTYWGW